MTIRLPALSSYWYSPPGPSTPPTKCCWKPRTSTTFGGCVVDQQFMDQMGSFYLLAHGLGDPVRDAVTVAKFPSAGEYHLT